MKRIYAAILAAVFSFAAHAAPQALSAQGFNAGPGYPESAAVRSGLIQSWLTAGVNEVLSLDPLVAADRGGLNFLVTHARNSAAGVFEIAVEPRDGDGPRGKWKLVRRLSDGLPERIVLYPCRDEAVRIELRPASADPERGKSWADLVVYGQYAAKSVPLGVPFVRLYNMSLAELQRLTIASFPWDLVFPDSERYGDIESAVAEIRSALPALVYLDDGAFDEQGFPVLIADGSAQKPEAVRIALAEGQDIAGVAGGVNCSGFAKWLVDGIIRPRAGTALRIAPLKTPTQAPETNFTEPFRESRDLFFGLDWTRNLASAAVSLTAGRTIKPDASGVDVISSPFAGASGYKKDVGYRASELIPLLYWLAVREPGHFYLGAVSRERGAPLLRQYHHVAAFFPWFDETGRFRLAVFESAVETESALFIARNSDAWVHLVRVRIPEAGYFMP